jgi:hypothetical protein
MHWEDNLTQTKLSAGGYTSLRALGSTRILLDISRATVISETRGVEIYQPPSCLKGSCKNFLPETRRPRVEVGPLLNTAATILQPEK